MDELIAIDTETTPIAPSGKVRGKFEVPDLVLASVATASGAFTVPWEDPEPLRGLVRQGTLVFHNAAFDLAVLTKAHPSLQDGLEEAVFDGRVLDTRVLYLMRDPDPPHRAISLKFLCDRLFGHRLAKGEVRTSFRRGEPLSEAQHEYARQDAIWTRAVAERLLELPLGCFRHGWGRQKEVSAFAVGGARSPDVLYSTAAALMAWNLGPVGLQVDREALLAAHRELEREVDRRRARAVEDGLATVRRKPKAKPFAPSGEIHARGRSWTVESVSPPVMGRVWKGQPQAIDGVITMDQGPLRRWFAEAAEALGVDPELSEKTGAISLSRDSWKDYYSELPSPLQSYLDMQKKAKYLSAFTRPLVESGARAVHPRYFVPGAATGRWSCSRPNLQQVPRRGIRHIYRARPGHRLVYADYPTLELYTLAHALSCMQIPGPLLETLRSGEDIHTRTAALMNNKPAAEVTPAERQGGKACSFGVPGGMGARKLWRTGKNAGLPWTPEEASAVRQKWLEAYPDVARYLGRLRVDVFRELKPANKKAEDWLRELGFAPEEAWPRTFDILRAVNGGRVFTVRLPSGRVLPERNYSAAANSFFQCLGADVITEAFIRATKEGLRVAAVVHDSITVEAPTAAADAAGRALTKVMADALIAVCPTVPRPQIEYEVTKRWH